MSKNKNDLIAEVKALDETFEPGESTKAEIAEVLAAMQAAGDSSESTEAEDETDTGADTEAETVDDAVRVAPGQAITSKKGILTAGDEVKAEYLSGGSEAFDNLKKLKVIV